MDGFHQYKGGDNAIHVTRVNDSVTLSVYRDNELLVQIDMTKRGAVEVAKKLIGVLS